MRGFWRTKRFIIIHESHFCRNKKMMLCIVPQVSFNLFQDDQYLANRHLHRTNDPICFPRCRQHTVYHIYVCCIRPCISDAYFHMTVPSFVSDLSYHNAYQHGRIPVECGQKATFVRVIDALDVVVAPLEPQTTTQSTETAHPPCFCLHLPSPHISADRPG